VLIFRVIAIVLGCIYYVLSTSTVLRWIQVAQYTISVTERVINDWNACPSEQVQFRNLQAIYCKRQTWISFWFSMYSPNVILSSFAIFNIALHCADDCVVYKLRFILFAFASLLFVFVLILLRYFTVFSTLSSSLHCQVLLLYNMSDSWAINYLFIYLSFNTIENEILEVVYIRRGSYFKKGSHSIKMHIHAYRLKTLKYTITW